MTSKNTFITLGASNHTEKEREADDFYATSPIGTFALLKKEAFNKKIWEPACGSGHISNVLLSKGYEVFSTDLFDRGYGFHGLDFLGDEAKGYAGKYDIITNPPYKYAEQFCLRAIELCNHKVAMLMRILFLEGIQRYNNLFSVFPPTKVYVFSFRLQNAKNGEFKKYEKTGSAQGYAWYIWEKGYNGKTELRWMEPDLKNNYLD